MQSSKLKLKKNPGQSLIEVLAALAMASLVLFGLVKVITVSVKNANYSQDQTDATSLAQERASEIIALKNNGPLSFFASLPTYPEELSADGRFCLKTTVIDNPDEIPPGSPSGAKMAKIKIDVFWEEIGIGADCTGKKYLHKFNLETDVTN